MTDTKVIEAYRICIDVDGYCYKCPYYLDDHIDPEDCNRKALYDILDLLKDRLEVVRCKDCAHYDSKYGHCHNGVIHGRVETWYCADGKRKDTAEEYWERRKAEDSEGAQ